jgi:hypothetical protein
MYEIDIEKFERAPRRKGLQRFGQRTYDAHKKEAAKVTEMPRKPTQPTPPPAAPAAPLPQREKPAATVAPKPAEQEISGKLTAAAKRLMQLCGLPYVGSPPPYVEAAIICESEFRGAEIEEAAKYLADCVQRDQRRGVKIGRNYFLEALWRSINGRGQPNQSQQRTQANRQGALGGIYREVLEDFSGELRPALPVGESPGSGVVPDGGEREHDSERGKGG